MTKLRFKAVDKRSRIHIRDYFLYSQDTSSTSLKIVLVTSDQHFKMASSYALPIQIAKSGFMVSYVPFSPGFEKS